MIYIYIYILIFDKKQTLIISNRTKEKLSFLVTQDKYFMEGKSYYVELKTFFVNEIIFDFSKVVLYRKFIRMYLYIYINRLYTLVVIINETYKKRDSLIHIYI